MAYARSSLAAARGDEDARILLNKLADRMTREQVAEAQKLSRELEAEIGENRRPLAQLPIPDRKTAVRRTAGNYRSTRVDNGFPDRLISGQENGRTAQSWHW